MMLIGVDYHPSFQTIARVAMGRRMAIQLYWMWRNGCEYSQSGKCGSYAGQLGTGHGGK